MLTLFADASYEHRDKTAGYGAWAKHQKMDTGMVWGGELPHGLHDASEAELWAIAKAVEHLFEQKVLAEATMLMIQSDSQRALQLILAGITQSRHSRLDPSRIQKGHTATVGVDIVLNPNIFMRATDRHALQQIEAIIMGRIPVMVRHVRGHQQGEGRNFVNNMCDRHAKFYRRQQSRKLNMPEPRAAE